MIRDNPRMRWEQMWQLTADTAIKGDKPQHGRCISMRADAKETCLLRLPLDLPHCTNKISLFLQVRIVGARPLQQNFFSLWHREERIVLEYHMNSGLGLCKLSIFLCLACFSLFCSITRIHTHYFPSFSSHIWRSLLANSWFRGAVFSECMAFHSAGL